VGLGILLAEGIGDTLRVSLAADAVEEVRVGWEILEALGIRQRGPMIIACPTCGRCEVDLFKLIEEVEHGVKPLRTPLKIAVMGCTVNGPGEAKDADFGIAAGKSMGLIFSKGKIINKVRANQLAKGLLSEIFKHIEHNGERAHKNTYDNLKNTKKHT
jgi:(E)-4-hydroxy-3-methylbut-2-enyl-diphosphate synthase